MPRADRRARADLLLDALEDHDVRVGRDPDGQNQARDARQRHRDRDQLDQREQVQRVDPEGQNRAAENVLETSNAASGKLKSENGMNA